MKNIKALAQAPDLSSLKVLFFDIDDTFSGGMFAQKKTHQITPSAYAALWRLKEVGVCAVPVTGRPAGWCDMITRMWPVDAVVGENGAFYLYQDKNNILKKVYIENDIEIRRNQKRLKQLKIQIEKKFAPVQFASDQAFREFDLAVDYNEDVKPWTSHKVDELIHFCRSRGAQAKLSSIHVNIWFGSYDKMTCVQRVLKDRFKISSAKQKTLIAYVGDSPNDEPFFKDVSLSFGVANVKKYFDVLAFKPKYVLQKECGLGFEELVNKIVLHKRRQLSHGRDSIADRSNKSRNT